MSEEIKQAIGEAESLRVFLEAMKSFEERFCRAMNEGADFTITLEVHGATGKLVHCRNHENSFQRPRGRTA